MGRREEASTPEALERERSLLERNPLALTKSVYFETSNCCQLSASHRHCPLNLLGEPPEHLPRSVVEGVLGRYGYGGEIRFHIMSEPLADPRLFDLVGLAREACPKARITLWSNGIALSQVLLDELAEAGVSTLLLTAYSLRERARLATLRTEVRRRIYFGRGFDESLLGQYDAEPVDAKQPCSAPLRRLSIGRDGSLMLCCRDWQKRHSFGLLTNEPLDKLILQQSVWDVYSSLRQGQRTLGLCRRCTRSR